LYLREKILSIKIEENKSVSSFISWIKEVKHKLSDISQTLANDDLMTITINSMTNDYQRFITRLNARGFEKRSLQEKETVIFCKQ